MAAFAAHLLEAHTQQNQRLAQNFHEFTQRIDPTPHDQLHWLHERIAENYNHTMGCLQQVTVEIQTAYHELAEQQKNITETLRKHEAQLTTTEDWKKTAEQRVVELQQSVQRITQDLAAYAQQDWTAPWVAQSLTELTTGTENNTAEINGIATHIQTLNDWRIAVDQHFAVQKKRRCASRTDNYRDSD